MNDVHFPNSSRSYDESKHRVCFWGYDKTMEVSFYIGVEALQKLRKGAVDAETELLAVFDNTLDKIHDAAARVYANGNKGKRAYTYILCADDF